MTTCFGRKDHCPGIQDHKVLIAELSLIVISILACQFTLHVLTSLISKIKISVALTLAGLAQLIKQLPAN